jgi:signal peptidase I
MTASEDKRTGAGMDPPTVPDLPVIPPRSAPGATNGADLNGGNRVTDRLRRPGGNPGAARSSIRPSPAEVEGWALTDTGPIEPAVEETGPIPKVPHKAAHRVDPNAVAMTVPTKRPKTPPLPSPELPVEDVVAPVEAEKPTYAETDEESSDQADDAELRPRPARGKHRVFKQVSFWKEMPILIGIALVLTILIQTFLARVYVIPSASMEQTLHGCPGCTGDRIIVDKMTYDFSDPSPGDVIVFKGPAGWEQSEFNVQSTSNPVWRWLKDFASSIGIGPPPEYDLVKRVIAVGGQTISCCDKQGRVLVDDKPLTEPYVYFAPGTAQAEQAFAQVTVPLGDLFVMGDNRNNSFDSRYQNGGGINGVVPASNVIGVARTIVWPPSRWRGIGEINPQPAAMTLGAAAGWPAQLPPLGVGFAAAVPTLWYGRRLRRQLHGSAGLMGGSW